MQSRHLGLGLRFDADVDHPPGRAMQRAGPIQTGSAEDRKERTTKTSGRRTVNTWRKQSQQDAWTSAGGALQSAQMHSGIHMSECHVLGVDVTRAQTVNSDPLGPQFAGHTARHLQNRRLRCVIRNPGMILSMRASEPSISIRVSYGEDEVPQKIYISCSRRRKHD